MEKQDIAVKIYSKIDELPTLSTIAANLLTLIEDQNSTIQKISQVITNDPALYSKILKVANSAYYGFSQQVLDIEHAITIIGFKMVKTLAISIGVIDIFPSIKNSELFTRQGLWQHSIATAVIMKEMNHIINNTENGDYLYTIGLLHDIGKIVLDYFFHEDFKKVVETANSQHKKLHEVENNFIGINHTEIAAILLTRWKIPDKITNPIASMHDHVIPDSTNIKDVSLLRIANSLAQELDLSKEGNINANLIHDKDKKALSITNTQIDDIRQTIYKKKGEINKMYEMITGKL